MMMMCCLSKERYFSKINRSSVVVSCACFGVTDATSTFPSRGVHVPFVVLPSDDLDEAFTFR